MVVGGVLDDFGRSSREFYYKMIVDLGKFRTSVWIGISFGEFVIFWMFV